MAMLPQNYLDPTRTYTSAFGTPFKVGPEGQKQAAYEPQLRPQEEFRLTPTGDITDWGGGTTFGHIGEGGRAVTGPRQGPAPHSNFVDPYAKYFTASGDPFRVTPQGQQILNPSQVDPGVFLHSTPDQWRMTPTGEVLQGGKPIGYIGDGGQVVSGFRPWEQYGERLKQQTGYTGEFGENQYLDWLVNQPASVQNTAFGILDLTEQGSGPSRDYIRTAVGTSPVQPTPVGPSIPVSSQLSPEEQFNRDLAQAVGYTGEFGGNQFLDWLIQQPQGIREQALSILDTKPGGGGMNARMYIAERLGAFGELPYTEPRGVEEGAFIPPPRPVRAGLENYEALTEYIPRRNFLEPGQSFQSEFGTPFNLSRSGQRLPYATPQITPEWRLTDQGDVYYQGNLAGYINQQGQVTAGTRPEGVAAGSGFLNPQRTYYTGQGHPFRVTPQGEQITNPDQVDPGLYEDWHTNEVGEVFQGGEYYGYIGPDNQVIPGRRPAPPAQRYPTPTPESIPEQAGMFQVGQEFMPGLPQTAGAAPPGTFNARGEFLPATPATTPQGAEFAGMRQAHLPAVPEPTLRGEPGELETVAGQLSQLLREGSPYISEARQQALEIANRRGLLNSSIAADSALRAVYAAALPIAQADATTYSIAAREDVQAQNLFKQLGYATDAEASLRELSAALSDRLASAAHGRQLQTMGYGAELEGGLAETQAALQNRLAEQAQGREHETMGYAGQIDAALRQTSAALLEQAERAAHGRTLQTMGAEQAYVLEQMGVQQRDMIERMDREQRHRLSTLAEQYSQTLGDAYVNSSFELMRLTWGELSIIGQTEGLTETQQRNAMLDVIDRRNTDMAYIRNLIDDAPNWNENWTDMPDWPPYNLGWMPGSDQSGLFPEGSDQASQAAAAAQSRASTIQMLRNAGWDQSMINSLQRWTTGFEGTDFR